MTRQFYISSVVLILIFALFSTGHSQQFFKQDSYNTDSLDQVLQTATGAERAEALCMLVWHYRTREPEKMIPLAEEAYQISKSSDDEKIKLMATLAMGLAYHHTGDYPKSIRYNFDAKEMAEKQHDTVVYYQAMTNIIISYLYSNNPDLAFKYAKITEAFMPPPIAPGEIFENSIRVGWVHKQVGDYPNAISYFRKAAKIAETSQQIPASNMDLNYVHTSNCYRKLQNFDSAYVYIMLIDSLNHLYEISPKEGINRYLAEYYYDQKQYDSAFHYYSMSLNNAIKYGNVYFQAAHNHRLGRIYRFRNEFTKAIEAFSQAIEKGTWIVENKKEHTDSERGLSSYYSPEQIVPNYVEKTGLQFLLDAHRNLYEIYKILSDDKNALKHLEAHNKVFERSRELQRQMEVIEMNTRYETERKESQIQLLTSENELNSLRLEQTRYYLFAIGGFALLAILVAILLIRQNRMKASQDKVLLEQRLLRAQMNPHFLFNTLSNIQSYMLDNDVDKASSYLSRFAKLMRNILDNSSLESIPLEQEVRTIENYLEIQKIRFPEKFDYSIEVDPEIDPEITLIPPMLAQPFIENSIEHGMRYRKEKGKINISIIKDINAVPVQSPLNGTGLIFIEVTDDGVGRGHSEQAEKGRFKDHRPMATSITRERLRILGHKVKRALRKKIQLEIYDLHDESDNPCGTKVRFGLPAEYQK